MKKFKEIFETLWGRVKGAPKPEGELLYKMSATFYIDLYIFIFLSLILYPFNDYFKIAGIILFGLIFVAGALPFVMWRVRPTFLSFFKGKNTFGAILTGYFLLLFMTFMMAYIHAIYLRGVGVNAIKIFIAYYTIVFLLMPFVLFVAKLSTSASQLFKRIKR